MSPAELQARWAAGPPDLGTTLSIVKALSLLGSRLPYPDDVAAFALAQPPSAAQLLCLHAIGAPLDPEPTLSRLAAAASTREEHFMVLAVVDECGATTRPAGSIAYFTELLRPNGTFGPDPLTNGIAASALLRVGEKLPDPQAVADVLLPSVGTTDLWTTYCVMRALSLLEISPDLGPLLAWLDSLPSTSDPNVVYQRLSVRAWAVAPAFEAARSGDIGPYLAAGGDPNLVDLQGWSLLCAAAVRGRSAAVAQLLAAGADPDYRVPAADALPIFWAGQSGDLPTVQVLLRHRPAHVFEVSTVNGHTVLLQAVFYGTDRHRALVEWLLSQTSDRKRLLVACNMRGFNATAMAQLWNNQALLALLSSVDETTADERSAYYADLLASVAPVSPEPGVDALVAAAGALDTARIKSLLDSGVDVNQLGGPLSQTAIIAAVTGTDQPMARLAATRLLLDRGADPDLPERHPMAVDAVIRSAVLNNFDCLRSIAEYMRPLAFAAALNERPAINGQTALDDTVHRALTASASTLDSHLAQIRWCVEHGARSDIPDFTGVTVADRARTAVNDPILGANAPKVLTALGGRA